MDSNIQVLFENGLGWIGTAAYLLSYLLLTIGKMKSSQLSYQSLNLLGAAGLTIHSGMLGDFPNFAVNLVWGLIASVALISIFRNRYLASKTKEK